MSKLNTAVNIAGVELKNPIVTASGTFGFGREFSEFFDLSQLGAVSVKGLTLKPKAGNPPPRVAESASGMLNSVGLQNPGVESFIKDELPFLRGFDVKIIANMAGNTVEDYVEMARILSDADVDMLEVNISCPNVKEGGVAFGVDERAVYEVTSRVKAVSKKPVIIKLSPNVTDIKKIAKAAESGGADALSLINTLLGMRIDIKTRRPILKNNTGGLSGPAVFPIAVRMVHDVYEAVKLPIIGMGGVARGEDAVELMMAGASAVAVGSAALVNPLAPIEIKRGLEKFMEDNGVASVSELTGSAKMW